MTSTASNSHCLRKCAFVTRNRIWLWQTAQTGRRLGGPFHWYRVCPILYKCARAVNVCAGNGVYWTTGRDFENRVRAGDTNRYHIRSGYRLPADTF